jgi:hypothetical protein
VPETLSPVSFSVIPISTHLLRLLPRGGVSVRNRDLRAPLLRLDPSGNFLEMRIESDPNEPSEFGLVRRLSLETLSVGEVEDLRSAVDLLDWGACVGLGVTQGLGAIETRRWERWLTGLLTFLNPRQMALLIYLYRTAYATGSVSNRVSTVEFGSDDLLGQLGYTRTKDGGFASKLRSQLHRDLVALHRTELVYPRSVAIGNFSDAQNRRVEVRSVLKILEAVPERSGSGFDLFRAADNTYEMADRYRVRLNFWDDRVTLGLPGSMDLSQRLGGNAKNDYRMRLLIYLASRMSWDALSDGQYMILSKALLFKNLDLLGTNGSRNNQIFWRTIEGLKQENFLINAQELPGKQKMNSIQFQINAPAFYA